MKIRKISRKAGCPDCCNSSTHNKLCPWAYVPEPDSKARYNKNVSVYTKLKAIVKIIKT